MQAEPHLLHCIGRTWAKAELLADDTAVFGFPVGRLLPLGSAPALHEREAAGASLHDWAKASGAAVLAASVSAADAVWSEALGALAFTCIDFSLQMTLGNMKKRPRPALTGSVRPATPADQPGIAGIAGEAFDFGRYHRDHRFPRTLADKRFAAFVQTSLDRPAPGTRFFVLGPEGAPRAFMYLTMQGGKAQWWLGGVAREASNGLLGPMLFAGVLDALEALGVRSVTAKISAANTGVMNIYSHLGFSASGPEYTFHWRNPASPYLLPDDAHGP
jgi:hypothetical protein